MTILPIEREISSFVSEDSSQNDVNESVVKKHFDTVRTQLFEYGALSFGKDYYPSLNPATIQAVRSSGRPVIPFFVSVVPPDVFPTGNFTKRRVPVPADVNLTLVNSRSPNQRSRNVETVRAIDAIVPSVSGFKISPDSFPLSLVLSYSFRTGGGVESTSRLPVAFTVSNPDLATVSEAGVVSLVRAFKPGEDVVVKASAIRQDLKELSAQWLITTDPLFEPQEAPDPTVFSGVDNTQETLVSIGESEDFQATQRQRFESFRTNYEKSNGRLVERLEDVNKRRTVIKDLYAEQSSLLSQERVLGDNERFLRNQVRLMSELPPLLMYVNPTELNTSYAHIIADGNKSRNGYIIEHIGLEQPTLSASGTIGGAYVLTKDAQGNAHGGLTSSLRRGSASYQQFLALYSAYRNNGYIFNADARIAMVGSVQLFYGDTIFTGSFESFSIQENAENPHTLSYSFEFKVRYEERVLNLT